jgi:hypothetical protein
MMVGRAGYRDNHDNGSSDLLLCPLMLTTLLEHRSLCKRRLHHIDADARDADSLGKLARYQTMKWNGSVCQAGL